MLKTKKLNKLKSFGDLDFGDHPSFVFGGKRAHMKFKNGYEVSVIQGGGAYTSNDSEYELAVMHNGNLCYSTIITSDVLGHISERQVSEFMGQVQGLKVNNRCKHQRKHN